MGEAALAVMDVGASAVSRQRPPRLGFALLAGALAVGPMAHADDHGDDRASATRVELPSETAGEIDRGDDVDWFRFEVAASGEVTAETTGDLDAVGTLYDASGNEIADDDDSGSGFNFRIQRTLDAGTYFVQVATFFGIDTGSYVLRLQSEASGDDADAAAAGATVNLRNLGDFNGDGKDDVLLRHQDGRWYYYPMDGHRVLPGSGEASLTTDLAWQAAGIGDFDGDGRADVLLRHTNGRWYFYPMNGRAIFHDRGTASLTSNTAWQVVGIGDFDGDGTDDVLLRHEQGRWHYYQMNGRRPLAGTGRASLTPNLAWRVAGIGDFDGDGRADVLLRHEQGRWYLYPMRGRAVLAGRGGVGLPQDLAWSVAGVSDFNADGRDDVLLRHSDGRWHFYPMSGRQVLDGAGPVDLKGDISAAIAGIGDMNGDGRADVLLRRANGSWLYYPLNGRHLLSATGEAALSRDLAWGTLSGPSPVGEAVPTTSTQLLGIAIIGLGATITTTNSQTVTISGVAESSDVDIESITYRNLTNNASGSAVGTTEWTAQAVTLAEGDNLLRFTVRDVAGRTALVETTITYFPALDFTTELTLSKDLVYEGQENVEVIANIGTSNTGNPRMSLVRIGNDGQTTPVIGQLRDDGELPDEIQGDGIYSGKFTFSRTTNGIHCYRVDVAAGQSLSYTSEQKCIWLTVRYNQEQINAAVGVADDAAGYYETRVAQGNSNADAAAAVHAQLEQDERVEIVGSSEDGGIWWVSKIGILGVYHPRIAGFRGSSPQPRESRANAPTPVKGPYRPIRYYPPTYLEDRSAYVPASVDEVGHQERLPQSSISIDEENRVQSTKAMILSPFRDIDDAFGPYDDYYGAWDEIRRSQICGLVADTEVVNTEVGLDHFKGWGEFGYVHISSHGDSFFAGLQQTDWDSKWGPWGFMADNFAGSFAQVAISTSIRLPKDPNGEWILDGYEDDIQSKRLVISADGGVSILPSFFNEYLEPLPRTIVVVGTCRSGYNKSLFNVLLEKGAGAFLGFDDYVNTRYAHDTSKEIVRAMLDEDSTFGDAASGARETFGTSDGGRYDAKLITLGNLNLKFASGSLVNGDFEFGSLTPWRRVGDGRIVQKLGMTEPLEGNYMGIISTGLGFTTETGLIAQPVCISDSARRLSFNWNFFSEEFTEYCGSAYDDTFQVQLCREAGNSSDCVTAFNTSVNLLCQDLGALGRSDIDFDRGDTYRTGWRNEQVDISSFRGERVDMQFFATDRGDSIYDTAILLDGISIE